MQASATRSISTLASSSPAEALPSVSVLPSHHRVWHIIDVAARVLLGLAFFVFGLDGFLHFMPMPDPSEIPAGAAALGGAMAGSGYMFPLIKGTEVLVGALLLSNRFVPLALTILAPVTVNIVLFHAVLAPAGIAFPLVLTGLQLFMAWMRRDVFREVLRARELTVI